MPSHITTITFKNYKTFKSYSVTIGGFNILVGPNNAGKSTIIGALRILGEGLRKAHARKAEIIESTAHRGYGYRLDLKDLPISTENIFTDYDDSEPARIEFGIAPSGKLAIVFPETDSCILYAETEGRTPQSPAEFKRAFDLEISFVPVLGPVEHNEQLFQIEAARRALQTHRASRNFRNIWYHYPSNFDEFKRLVESTWSSVSIRAPELSSESGTPRLHMFYEEHRVPREMFWSGFGFQAWCQMLTYIAKSPSNALLVIDEPDVYLHSDLQRQLVQVLRDRGGDTLIATHSTEILGEAETGEIVVIDRKAKRSRKISRPIDLEDVFASLGSVLNPILTQLSKTRKVVFVEGGDFAIIGAFARKLGNNRLANQGAFAVVSAFGFNPSRVRDFSDGMENSLGYSVSRAVIFDRDYRLDEEVQRIKRELLQVSTMVRVHNCKELENFLLVSSAITRCVDAKIRDREKRGAKATAFCSNVDEIIDEIAAEVKADVFGKFSAKAFEQLRAANPSWDAATINTLTHRIFEERWSDRTRRLRMLPGKKVLARVNERLQTQYAVSVTPKAIIAAMAESEIDADMKELVAALNQFAFGGPGPAVT